MNGVQCSRCNFFGIKNCDLDETAKISQPCSSCKSQRKVCSECDKSSSASGGGVGGGRSSKSAVFESGAKVIPPVLPLLGSLYTDTPELYMSCIDNLNQDACPIFASASFQGVRPPSANPLLLSKKFKFGRFAMANFSLVGYVCWQNISRGIFFTLLDEHFFNEDGIPVDEELEGKRCSDTLKL